MKIPSLILYNLWSNAYKTERKEKPLTEKTKDTLEEKLNEKLSEIKKEIKLDRSVFGSF